MHKPKFFKIFLLIFVLLLMAGKSFGQQSLLSKKVTYSFSGMQLGTVLRKLQNQTGVKFSYNPELIATGKRITMKGTNQPLGEVLKQLLGDPGISYKEIGDQLVLYRSNPSIAIEVPKAPITVKPAEKRTPDTVSIHDVIDKKNPDTITIYRTVNTLQIDTVRIRDTIFIEKYKTQKPGKKFKSIFTNSLKQQKFLKDNGLYFGFYGEMLPGSMSYNPVGNESETYTTLLKSVDKIHSGNFSTGLITGYDYFRFGVRSGIGYTRLGEKFDYSFSKESGGFFKIDTVERWYSLTGNDTTFFYLTKPSWVPKETQNYIYKNPNTYSYIDIPVSLKFRLWQNESGEVYALGGVSGRFLISSDALHIDPKNIQNAIWTSNKELAPAVFSWHAGLGGAMKIGDFAGVLGEITYYKQMNNQYKDLPVNKTYSLVGLKIGVYLKL